MKLETQLECMIPPYNGPAITYESRLMFAGSCFAQEISTRAKADKFNVAGPVFGTIFHPMVLATLLKPEADDSIVDFIYEREGVYLNHLLHSSFNAPTAKELSEIIKNARAEYVALLSTSTHLIITLGTAWGYELKAMPGHVIGNNHKRPAVDFTRKLATVSDIAEKLRLLFEAIRSKNPAVSIILTVSPVFHTRTHFAEDSVSKASLLLACHQLQHMVDGIYYFPAFELLRHQLRDYRFYKTDMQHPNEQAADFIYKIFSSKILNETTQLESEEVRRIQSFLNHRTLTQNSDLYQYKLVKIEERIARWPALDWTVELTQLEGLIRGE